MDDNNRINEDLNNIITAFEKRTQQISEEQREARERFIVALSELSRQYDLLREWTEKSNNELKTFLEKLLSSKEGDELLLAVKDIVDKTEKIPQGFANLLNSIESIEKGLEQFLDKIAESKETNELIQVVKKISETIEKIPQEFTNIVKSIESVENMTKGFSEPLNELRTFTNEMKDSFNSLFSTYNESIEKLIKVIKETNAGILTKQDEIFEKLFNKIDEISASFKETLSGFQNSLGPLFEKIEKTLLESLEKQLSVSGEMKNAIISLNDGVSDIQKSLKKVNENIETLSKKQDVVSAVIDKRGEGIEEKLTFVEDAIKKLTETFIKELSLLPEELNKYLDLNKEILTQIKTTESNVGNISKTIEDLTRSIVENEKKREEKEIIKEAQNHLSRGVILFYRGSIGVAEKEIRKAIELKNDFAEAYLNLGMVLGETGKTEEAIEKIKKALEIEPGLEEAYNNLGVIQLKGEMYEEAVESFNEAIKLGFKYPILYLNMAKALVSLERIEEAVDSLKKVIEIDPTNAEAKDLLSTYQRGSQ